MRPEVGVLRRGEGHARGEPGFRPRRSRVQSESPGLSRSRPPGLQRTSSRGVSATERATCTRVCWRPRTRCPRKDTVPTDTVPTDRHGAASTNRHGAHGHAAHGQTRCGALSQDPCASHLPQLSSLGTSASTAHGCASKEGEQRSEQEKAPRLRCRNIPQPLPFPLRQQQQGEGPDLAKTPSQGCGDLPSGETTAQLSPASPSLSSDSPKLGARTPALTPGAAGLPSAGARGAGDPRRLTQTAPSSPADTAPGALATVPSLTAAELGRDGQCRQLWERARNSIIRSKFLNVPFPADLNSKSPNDS